MKTILRQKIAVSSLECMENSENKAFFKCTFQDELGSEKMLSNIVFGNIEVENASSTLYRNDVSEELIVSMTFRSVALCEVIGHTLYGLTLKCKERPQ